MPRKAVRSCVTDRKVLKPVQQSVKDEEMDDEKPTDLNDKKKQVAPRTTRKRPTVNYTEDDEEEAPAPKRRGRPPKSGAIRPKDEEEQAIPRESRKCLAVNYTEEDDEDEPDASSEADAAEVFASKSGSKKNPIHVFMKDDSPEIDNCLLCLPLPPHAIIQSDWKFNERAGDAIVRKLEGSKDGDFIRHGLSTPKFRRVGPKNRLEQGYCRVSGRNVANYRQTRTAGKRGIAKSIREKVFGGDGFKISDSIGHIVGEVLGGSDELDNLFIQNSEINWAMAPFEINLADALVMDDEHFADMFWRMLYEKSNKTTRPDQVEVSIRIVLRGGFTGEIHFVMLNRTGEMTRIDGPGPPSVQKKFWVFSSFDEFLNHLHIKYPEWEGVRNGEANSKGFFTPNHFSNHGTEQSRISSARFRLDKLQKSNERRWIGQTGRSAILGANQYKGYDVGHIIPGFLFGSDDVENLFCQNSEYNRTMGYSFEAGLRVTVKEMMEKGKAIKKPVLVEYVMERFYDDPNRADIPSSLNYGYRFRIGGQVLHQCTFQLLNPSSAYDDVLQNASKYVKNPFVICRRGVDSAVWEYEREKEDIGTEARYFCIYCKYTTARSDTLNEHMRTHNNEKSCRCDECGEFFTHQSGLNRHRGTHTGGKRHKCKECGEEFSRSDTLARHRGTHTGEKQHECKECGKAFARSDSLQSHTRIHNKNGTKLKCPVCSTGCIRDDTLKRHIKNRHPNEFAQLCPI